MLFLLTTSAKKNLEISHSKIFKPNTCVQCWTCANCRYVLYKSVEIRPSRDGCSKSWFGHNWAYQGCKGDKKYKCKRCKIQISVDYTPVNIKSDNCTINDDDNGKNHQFVEIN